MKVGDIMKTVLKTFLLSVAYTTGVVVGLQLAPVIIEKTRSAAKKMFKN